MAHCFFQCKGTVFHPQGLSIIRHKLSKIIQNVYYLFIFPFNLLALPLKNAISIST